MKPTPENTAFITLSKSSAMLTKARKNLRVLSQAHIAGNPKATLEIIAYAALSVARLENVVACRRIAEQTPANPNHIQG